MTLMLLSLLATIASAADSNGDGCEDSYFDANGACVSSLASLGSGTTVGASVDVGDYASVGADVAIGASATIGARSTIVGRVAASGARPIGVGTVIGRRAFIDADHDIGADNTFGRAVDIGERLQTESSVTLGFGVELGDDVQIASGATVGSLVHVGNNTSILTGTVIARGADIADSSGTATVGGVIGPDVTIGADSTIASTARIRKDASLGSDVTVLGGARIGRDAIIEDGATIGANVRIGAGATVTGTTSVPEGAVIPRGDTYDDPVAADCIAPWFPVQGQGGLSNGIGTGTVFTQQGSSKTYNSVVLSHDFSGDFEVIASWDANHVGIGTVHGSGVSYTDVNGYSSNGGGTYWNDIRVTGFPNGYSGSFKGHYNLNSSSDPSTRYFRWLRQGTTLSVQSSLSGESGPWQHIPGSPWSVSLSDTVVIGIGEGAGDNTNEQDPLRLLSCSTD